MNILTIFGSLSDKDVYEPLTEDLGKSFTVENVVLSAHRNPEQLRELIAKDKYELYVAGAGLAAHLPGVIASLTKKPVVGLPVAAAFDGLDSLFSILQMPFGVPVLTFGPGKLSSIRPFLEKASRIETKNEWPVVARGECERELDRLDKKVSEMGGRLKSVTGVDSSRACINFVTKKEDILEGNVINVPLLPRDSHYKKALEVFDWVVAGETPWVGMNNSRNAFLWWHRFFNRTHLGEVI